MSIKLSTDIYRHYRRTNNECVPREVFYKILDLYLRFFIQELSTGVQVKIPAGLGSFKFVGRKQKIHLDEHGEITGAPVDWGATNKLWIENQTAKQRKQLVYCLNEHTNGYIYKIRWSYKRAYGKYKLLYVFRPSRKLKVRFAKLLKENVYEYETQEQR